MYVFVCNMCTSSCGGQEIIIDNLKLKLNIIVSLLIWVLGTKLQSFRRAESVLNDWASFLALELEDLTIETCNK